MFVRTGIKLLLILIDIIFEKVMSSTGNVTWFYFGFWLDWRGDGYPAKWALRANPQSIRETGPGDRGRLTLKACVLDSATWCSPAWSHPMATVTAFRGPRVAGAPSTEQALRGHTGEGTIVAASMATTTTPQATGLYPAALGSRPAFRGSTSLDAPHVWGQSALERGKCWATEQSPGNLRGPQWAGDEPECQHRLSDFQWLAFVLHVRPSAALPQYPSWPKMPQGKGQRGTVVFFSFTPIPLFSNPLNTYFKHTVSTKCIHCSSGSKNISQMDT